MSSWLLLRDAGGEDMLLTTLEENLRVCFLRSCLHGAKSWWTICNRLHQKDKRASCRRTKDDGTSWHLYGAATIHTIRISCMLAVPQLNVLSQGLTSIHCCGMPQYCDAIWWIPEKHRSPDFWLRESNPSRKVRTWVTNHSTKVASNLVATIVASSLDATPEIWRSTFLRIPSKSWSCGPWLQVS